MLTATDSGPIAAAIQTVNQPMIAAPLSTDLDPAIQTAYNAANPEPVPVLEPGMTGYGGLATLDGNTLGMGGYTDPAGVVHSYASDPAFTAQLAAVYAPAPTAAAPGTAFLGVPTFGPPAPVPVQARAAVDPGIRYDPRPPAHLPDQLGAATVAPIGGSPVAAPVGGARGVAALFVGVPIVAGRPVGSYAASARGAFGSLVAGLAGHRVPRHLHDVTRTPLTP